MEADQVVQDPLVQDIDPRQPSFALSTGRACSWCHGPLEVTARIDARFCSQRCRQAAHRFGRHCEALERAAEPMRLAYADPPYPGLSKRYYEGHPDYAGEVDHEALLSRLQEFDGWALSTSADALPEVLAIAAAMGLEGVRVAAWVRGARPTPSRSPLTSWEPVLYGGGRRELSDRPALDSLSHVSRPRTTDPDRVVGAKPADFAWWLFSLLGARPGDDFHDLFPGSGGMSRAWAALEARAVLPAVSAEPSRSPADDVSCSADGHASHLEDVDASPVDTLTRDWIGELRDKYADHPSRVDDCDGCQTFGICAKHLSAAEALARGEAPCPNCGAEAGEPCKGRCVSPPRSKKPRAASKKKKPKPSPVGLGKRRPKNVRGIQRGSPPPLAGSPGAWCDWCDQPTGQHYCPGFPDEIVLATGPSDGPAMDAEAESWCPSCGVERGEPCIPIDDAVSLGAPGLVHRSRVATVLVARYGHNALETTPRVWSRLSLRSGVEVWCPRALLERWADDASPTVELDGSAVQPSGEADEGNHEGGARP